MARKKPNRKRLWVWLFAMALTAGAALFAANRTVLSAAEGRVYTDVRTIPSRRVALVLGTTPTVGGRQNLFFVRRMQAAARLYHAGKVEKLLVSGDNGTLEYDEPTAMKKALVARAVPEQDIVADYAGFRTLDSLIRAHKVFGLNRLIIVTDDFHLPRSLYIAQHEGIDAIGFQTEPLPRSVAP